MRWFVRSFTVKRHVQFSVVQDGDSPSPYCEVVRWAPDSGLETVARFPYPPGRSDLMDAARNRAVAAARRLADEARAALEANMTDKAREALL